MTQEQLIEVMTLAPARQDSLPIVIKRFFTDVNGVIVDKAAVPAALQVSYPVWMFGEFDRMGGFNLANKNTPPNPGTPYLCTFIYGVNNPLFFGFSGASDIQGKLQIGDIVNIFTDNLIAPNYFIWIVQSCPTKPLASILQNISNLAKEGKYEFLRSSAIDFYTDEATQYDVNLQWITYNYIGLVKTNNLEPSIYLTPNIPQNGFVRIYWNTEITQYLGLNTYLLFATDNLTLNFQIKTKK